MIKQVKSLDELKRRVYLWVVPFIFIALVLNSILQNSYSEYKFSFIENNILSACFLISWILLCKNRFVKLAEYTNLVVVSLYHVSTMFDSVYHYMVKSGSGSLGDFIIWMPLYLMFIFLTLGTKRGCIFSIFIFAITFVTGFMFINRLSSDSIDSLVQFHFANLVYIIIFYFVQHMGKAFAEVELMKKHAFFDFLTGIANRHRIDEWLEKKVKAFKEKQESFSIIFFDIDHFKKINDEYGHKIGDSVLKELAALIQSNLSHQHLFGRWGGEEFIVITDVSGNDTVKLAQHFRELVEAHYFEGAGKLTASFGVTDSHPGDNIETLLNRVDEGLYRSKHCGRNQVSRC